jgi:hypothetical protein
MRLNKIALFALALIALLLLSACGPAPAEPTPTPGSGGPADTGSESGDSGSTDPGSSGDAPGAGTDTTTGLTAPPFAPIPSGAVRPPAPTNLAHGSAVLVIEGDLPIVYSGGDCDLIGEEMYLTIYPAENPGASFIIYPGTGSTRQGSLVWARTGLPQDNAGVSNEDPLTITLNEDGFSGSFSGRAFRVGAPGEPVAVPISVSGSFTCIAHLMRVGGDHPLDLAGISCVDLPSFTLRGGNPSGDAVWLIAPEGATAGSTGEGALSWRVGGANYTSNWLSLTINPDGVSGSYFGEGRNADGSETFTIQGSFNCLGA